MIRSHLLLNKVASAHPFWIFTFENLACGIAPIGMYISDNSLYNMKDHLKFEELNNTRQEIQASIKDKFPNMTQYFVTPPKLTKMNLIHLFVTRVEKEYNLSADATKKLYADIFLQISFKHISYQILQQELDTPDTIMDRLGYKTASHSRA